jgi:hypothetical protein
MKHKTKTEPTLPASEFKAAVAKIMSVSKAESDQQMETLHADNVRRRAAKRKG